MKCLLATSLLALVPIVHAAAQEWRHPLPVAEETSELVEVDGCFGTAEWNDALLVSGTDPCDIHLKRRDGHVFIGIECPQLELPVLDLFLMPEAENVYQLHVSSYLAERVLNQENADSLWQSGLRLDWTANTIEWNTAVRDSLAAVGVYGWEMLRKAVLPFDGFEVRVREGQFSSSQWRLRVRVSQFAGDGAPFVFPPDSGIGGTVNDWLLLDLRPPTIFSGRGG